MNAAEIKLDMFRRIDNLPKTDLEKIYNKFLALINSTSNYKLSKAERLAIEQALEESEKGNAHSHEDVMTEAKQKYPNLKFK
ncbi:MAG: hypothetical protein JEZ09_13265 [Salinivirgaceae bacterium]|nr:hypothetical protein [Salinivirgaceae bacterium]